MVRHEQISKSGMDARSRQLMRTLVGQYIQDGHPVGSRTLARCSGLDLSAATIRNVMADLEESGLVSAPHTSAGRVPTARGYRLFVDTLLRIDTLDAAQLTRIRPEVHAGDNTEDLIRSVSDRLSELTQFVGLVTAPREGALSLKHVEFLSLGPTKVLVILVLNGDEVQNRIIKTERSYRPSELENAANYLNQHFVGKSLKQIHAGLLEEIRQAKEQMGELMAAAVAVAEAALRPHYEKEMVVSGESKLMGYADFADLEQLRSIFEAFERKSEILHLLGECIHARGVQLFIGEESGFTAFGDCTIVTAPYSVDEEVVGMLGVIGPTRMAYDQVIPVVDATAKMLSGILNQTP